MVDMVAEHVGATTKPLDQGAVDEFTKAIRAVTLNEISGIFKRSTPRKRARQGGRHRYVKIASGRHGYVVSVQSGLNENLIAEMIGEDRTIGAFINFGADYHGPGDILFGARSTVVVSELEGEITPRLQTLNKELQAFEPNAIATNNVWGFLWSKLAYCSLLWANAVIDGELNDVFGSKTCRLMLTELTREVIRIAEADGTKLEPFAPFDPKAFTRDADQSAADRAFETIFNHRLGVPRNTAVCGAISPFANVNRAQHSSCRARRRRAARSRDAAQHAHAQMVQRD